MKDTLSIIKILIANAEAIRNVESRPPFEVKSFPEEWAGLITVLKALSYDDIQSFVVFLEITALLYNCVITLLFEGMREQ